MTKKLGSIFGIFFMLLSLLNYLNNPTIYRMNVVGSFIIGLVYLITARGLYFSRVIQVFLLFGYGCLALTYNDPNSLVPTISYIISVSIAHKYFPNLAFVSFIFPTPYIGGALLCHWQIYQIGGNILLYFALTTILFIINNDHV